MHREPKVYIIVETAMGVEKQIVGCFDNINKAYSYINKLGENEEYVYDIVEMKVS